MNVLAGDVIRVSAIGRGHEHRLGEVLTVEGAPGHERLHVRWEDDHESLLFPGRGVEILHREGEESHSSRGRDAHAWDPLHD